MSFDAGSIIGDLGLNMAPFTKGFDDADEAAKEHTTAIRESILSVGEAAELLGNVSGLDAFAGKLGQIAGAFAGGGLFGSLSAVTSLFGGLREVVSHTAEDYHQIGIEAQKAGVSTQWLSSMGVLAKESGSSVQGLAHGLQLLQERAALFTQGDAGASKGFEQLGLTVEQVQPLLNNSQALFELVTDRINALGDGGHRTAAAMEVMSRAGAELVPIILKGTDAFREQQELMERTGAVVTDANVRQGDSFVELQSVIDAVWTGVEHRLATPVLSYLQDNMSTIIPEVLHIADVLGNDVPQAISLITQSSKTLLPILQDISNLLSGIQSASQPLVDSWTNGAYTNYAQGLVGGDPYKGGNNDSLYKNAVVSNQELKIIVDAGMTPDQIADIIKWHLSDLRANQDSATRRQIIQKAIGAERGS